MSLRVKKKKKTRKTNTTNDQTFKYYKSAQSECLIILISTFFNILMAPTSDNTTMMRLVFSRFSCVCSDRKVKNNQSLLSVECSFFNSNSSIFFSNFISRHYCKHIFQIAVPTFRVKITPSALGRVYYWLVRVLRWKDCWAEVQFIIMITGIIPASRIQSCKWLV